MAKIFLLWTIAAAFAMTGSAARSQELLDFRQVILCKSLTDNAARLQCFDRAVSNAPSERPADIKVIDVDSDWQISESRSPADDMARLAAVLQSVEGTAALVLRCYDRITDAYLSLRTYVGGVEPLPVTYRFNEGTPTETRLVPSREGGALFLGTPTLAIAFARALPDDATMYVKVRDFQNRTTDLTFKLGPVSDIRDKLATACRWPEPVAPVASSTSAPPPATVARAAAPAPIKRVRHRQVPANQQRWNVNVQR